MRPRLGRGRLLVISVAVVAVVAAAIGGVGLARRSGGDAPAPGSRPAALPTSQSTATLIARVDGVPTALVADGSRLLVSTQDGRLVAVEPDSGHTADELVLDVRADTLTDATDGLLGVALSPDGNWLLVDRIDTTRGLVVESYPYEAGRRVDPTRRQQLLALQRPGGADHFGGALAFGRNATLFVTVGDQDLTSVVEDGRRVPGVLAQDPASRIGAVLAARFDERTGRIDGSFATVAYGLRNPWRLSIDSDLGDLWIGDVGARHVEEVDRVRSGDLEGRPANFGWPMREGNRAGPLPGDPPNGVAPVLARAHGTGVCAMIGGHVYRGSRIPALYGAYLYGDLCSSEIRALVPRAGQQVLDSVVVTTDEPPISFGVDGDHELYVLGTGGGVYRIDPGTPRHAPDVVACDVLCIESRLAQESDTGGETALTPACKVSSVMATLAHQVAAPALTYGDLDQALGTAVRALRRVAPSVAEGTREHVDAIVRLLAAAHAGERAAADRTGEDQPAATYVQTHLSGAGSRRISVHMDAIGRQLPAGCR